MVGALPARGFHSDVVSFQWAGSSEAAVKEGLQEGMRMLLPLCMLVGWTSCRGSCEDGSFELEGAGGLMGRASLACVCDWSS